MKVQSILQHGKHFAVFVTWENKLSLSKTLCRNLCEIFTSELIKATMKHHETNEIQWNYILWFLMALHFIFFHLIFFYFFSDFISNGNGVGMGRNGLRLRGGAGAALRSPAAWAKLPRGLRGVSWRPKKTKRENNFHVWTTFLTCFFQKNFFLSFSKFPFFLKLEEVEKLKKRTKKRKTDKQK